MMIKRLKIFMNFIKKFSTQYFREVHTMRKGFRKIMQKYFNRCSQINTPKIESIVLNRRIEK